MDRIPTCYDGGLDLPLFQANKWRLDAPGAWTDSRIEVRRVASNALAAEPDCHWVVAKGDAFFLALPDEEGQPILFVWRGGTKFSTSEEAFGLLEAYLSQPVNPYLWLRTFADRADEGRPA